MLLKVTVADQTFHVTVPEAVLQDAESFFSRIDRDLDRGWQMSRSWVDCPDDLQRCQIVADRLLTALEQDNRQLTGLLAAYILKRCPGTAEVIVDVHGNIMDTELRAGP